MSSAIFSADSIELAVASGLMGLAAAPVFPSLIAATPVRIGEAHTGNAIGFQISAAVLGQSLLPGMVGVLANHVGLEIVGPAMLTASLLLLALYEAMTAMGAKAPQVIA